MTKSQCLRIVSSKHTINCFCHCEQLCRVDLLELLVEYIFYQGVHFLQTVPHSPIMLIFFYFPNFNQKCSWLQCNSLFIRHPGFHLGSGDLHRERIPSSAILYITNQSILKPIQMEVFFCNFHAEARNGRDLDK